MGTDIQHDIPAELLLSQATHACTRPAVGETSSKEELLCQAPGGKTYA
jgi:hypothetical protein